MAIVKAIYRAPKKAYKSLRALTEELPIDEMDELLEMDAIQEECDLVFDSIDYWACHGFVKYRGDEVLEDLKGLKDDDAIIYEGCCGGYRVVTVQELYGILDRYGWRPIAPLLAAACS